MTDQGKSWLKLWTCILTDSKAANLSPADFGKWIRLMLAVKLEGKQGMLEIEHPGLYLLNLLNDPENPIEHTFESLVNYVAWLPGVDIKRFKDKKGLISVQILFRNWERYQGYIDTTNADRQKRYRERNAEVTEAVTDEITDDRNGKVTNPPLSSVSVSNSIRANPRAKSSPKKTKEITLEHQSLFIKFWNWYPLHLDKQRAIQAFSKLSDSEIAEIFAAIPNYKFALDLKGDPIHPYAATWLNGKRWQDEPIKHEKKYDPAYGDYSSEEERLQKRKQELEELEKFREQHKGAQ